MKIYVCVILSLCFVIQSKAQTPAALKGVVVETSSNGKIEPIAGALIHWLGNNKAVSTDSLGVFYVPLDAKSNRLIVQAIGFKTDTITVNGGNNLRVMMISKRNFEDVVVSYERKTTEVSFIDPWKTTIMNEKELFKAACCNLSESFETNPSVDVAYGDALTGTKQIQMLGLGGQYTQMSIEQLPGIRGIATNFGLSYIPGTWINSIQVSKGMGSVVNGFESVSGLINVELHKPTTKEKVYLNAYASEGGRYEANVVFAHQPSKMFSHALFLHGSTFALRMDRNKDGYMDNPIGSQGNVLYRFLVDNKTGFVFQGSIQYLRDEKTGGQMDYERNHTDTNTVHLYGTQVDAERLSASMRLGYVFKGSQFRSVGLQMNASQQSFDNLFGKNIYTGRQKSFYSNLIYQDILGNINHKVRTGLSLQIDSVSEILDNKQSNYYAAPSETVNKFWEFPRYERVAGVFGEYTYSYLAVFTLVAGARADYHSRVGWMFVPRLHLRYAPWSSTVFRASAGKGWRTANLLNENMSSLLSSRRVYFNNANHDYANSAAYGYKPEVAWNFGVNITHEFKLNYRKGNIGIDYYYTQFENQVFANREFARTLVFTEHQGGSFSSSFQIQADYQPIRRFDVRFAYRWFDVENNFTGTWLQLPFIAKHRWFLNMAYTTKSNWGFDVTLNRVGEKRIPPTTANPEQLQLPSYSDPYMLVNAQISKKWKKRLDVYIGMENIFNFQQPNAILDPANPFGTYFDASLTWGPVFGRMVYGGLRFKM